MNFKNTMFEDIEKLKENINNIDEYAKMSLTEKLPDGREITYTFAPSLGKIIELSKEQQKSPWYAMAKLIILNDHYEKVHKGIDTDEDYDICTECKKIPFAEKKEKTVEYMQKILDFTEEFLKEK